MKILVLNSGSSSIKFKLFSIKSNDVLASGLIEQIGEKMGSISMESNNNKSYNLKTKVLNHKQGFDFISEFLVNAGIIKSMDELDGIGHRVVHGGTYKKPILVDDAVMKEIDAVSILAPLHGHANLIGMQVANEYAPHVPQVAVFDTAYHQTIPDFAHTYAIPYDYYERLHVRRYGFHGTSHEFVANEAATFLKKPLKECNFISLHLGNGASVCAIKNGKSIDTSMGLSPLEGLIMGTRSGDIDPAILFYIGRIDRKIGLKELDKILNKESGLKGICGLNDMREIEESIKKGNKKAKLAHDMFCYRIKKYIGAYFAVLENRVDAIIFTGGIGENSALVREKVCSNMTLFNVNMDIEKNNIRQAGIVELQDKNSKTKILKVPTNEEFAIAKLTYKMINK